MFSTNNPEGEKNPLRYQVFYNKLLFCLAVALLLLAALPSVSWAATLTLGGTNPITETGICSTSSTITITLTPDNTWATDVVSNQAKLNTLIDSFGAAAEPGQWDLVMAARTVVRTSDAVVTITLPPVPGYNISANQTININIAPSLLSDSNNPISNALTFSIIADCQATLSSSITSATDIVNGGNTISIALTNDTWNTDIINLAAKRDKLFGSFPAPVGDSEWTKVINALKAAPDPSKVLALSSDKRTLTITLPAVPDYLISSAQTIKVDYSNWTTVPLLIITDALATNQPNLSFTINPSFSTATLEGTVMTTTPLTETNIFQGGQTIVITLNNNTWLTGVDTIQAKINTLIDGFTAASDTASWNLVKTELKAGGVKLTNPNVLTITLPSVSGYNISADQTVTLNIPSTLLAYNYPVTITPNSFTITADSAVTVSGTATPSLTETDIVTGGKTIIITLTSDTWDADVITLATKREALIDGFKFTSSTADNDQWNNALSVIKASAGYTRVSDTVVTITLPPVAGFNISGSLKVNLTVPGSVVKNLADDKFLPVVSAFTLSPTTAQSAKLSGTAVSSATEAAIAAGGKTIVITLSNDIWAPDIATNSTKRNNLLGGLIATGADSDNWNNTTNGFIHTLESDPTVVVRTSDTVVTITLPAASGFAISGNITVNLNIQTSILTTASGSITASPAFTISAITAVLKGTAIDAPQDSASIVTGGKTITITLTNATWVSDIVTNYSQLINGFSSTDSTDWKTIKDAISSTNVIRTSNTVVTIKLPPVPGYTTSGQSVTLIIPKDLITGGNKNVTATPKLQIGLATASATLTGTMLSSVTKSDIVSGGETIIIDLDGCTWATDAVSNTTKCNALLKGFVPATDPTNWNLVIAAIQANPNRVKRISDTNITITLPPVPGYDPVNDQTISLTIPKTVLVSAAANIVVADQIEINLPSYSNRGTLQSLLDNSGLADYINTKPLQQIYLAVPIKYITSIVAGQTTLGDTVVTSLDICTDSSVDKVTVTVNGTTYTTSSYVPYGKGNKFNIGFSYIKDTTTSTSTGSTSTKLVPIDAVIRVVENSTKLQSDVTIKISGSKTYALAPSTDLSGSYSLYKLVNNSSLLTNILNFYIPADIKVQTP
jgi:hypothetical protein